jgi:hypothetical protein
MVTSSALPSSSIRTCAFREVALSFFALVTAPAQGHHQPRSRHLQQVKARLASGRLQIRGGRTTELQNLESSIASSSQLPAPRKIALLVNDVNAME